MLPRVADESKALRGDAERRAEREAGHPAQLRLRSVQVLPKLSSSIVHEIDSILGNKPYSKKDYRS